MERARARGAHLQSHAECQHMVGLKAPAVSPTCMYLLGTSLARILIPTSAFLVFNGGDDLLACHAIGCLFVQRRRGHGTLIETGPRSWCKLASVAPQQPQCVRRQIRSGMMIARAR
jgi:hypothetical protein